MVFFVCVQSYKKITLDSKCRYNDSARLGSTLDYVAASRHINPYPFLMRMEREMNYRAYFGIKFHEDNLNRDEIDSISVALQDDGIQTVCIARDVEKWGDVTLSFQELMRITFEEIDKSDFLILEMSEKGIGLGIEAGYAVARKKPLIVLIKQGLELSNTMQGIADIVIPYSQPEEIKISAHVKSLQRTPASSPPELKR